MTIYEIKIFKCEKCDEKYYESDVDISIDENEVEYCTNCDKPICINCCFRNGNNFPYCNKCYKELIDEEQE